MKSKRKVLLALTINKHYFIRGVVRYAREHDWYLVTDMMYTGRVPSSGTGTGNGFCHQTAAKQIVLIKSPIAQSLHRLTVIAPVAHVPQPVA